MADVNAAEVTSPEALIVLISHSVSAAREGLTNKTIKRASDALKMAWFRCKRPSGVIVHTDRGSQHCSNDFQKLLRQYGMRSSMSRKGDCWDNAVAESLFHSFKVKAVQGEEFGSRMAMRETVFEYIEVYYNRQRLHSALGYMSPEQFEARRVA